MASSPRAKTPTAKGLDGAAAQELIEHTLKLLTNDEEAKKTKPAIEAALELARQGSFVDGKPALSITGIRVGLNPAFGSKDDGSVTVVFNQSGPPVNARVPRKVIAYGGTHYTCILLDMGPFGSQWVCVYF